MSSLAEIERAIDALPPEQFETLAQRIVKRREDEWDEQIERDANSGRLDFLLAELDQDIAAGRTKSLDEVCGDS